MNNGKLAKNGMEFDVEVSSMKINYKYEIRIVVVEITDSLGNTGDVYDNFNEFKMEKPESSYRFGFVVINTETGYIPDNCNDWNDSIEDAIADYEYNCQ